MKDKIVQEMQSKGYTNIRVNQQQIAADGKRLGINRPDIQGTNPATGKREYVEIDTTKSNRGEGHAKRLLANDPDAEVRLITQD